MLEPREVTFKCTNCGQQCKAWTGSAKEQLRLCFKCYYFKTLNDPIKKIIEQDLERLKYE